MIRRYFFLGAAAVALLLAGCIRVPGVAARTESAQLLTEGAGLLPFTMTTALPLPLRGFARLQEEQAALVVYIEGDGRAWINRQTPSNDPTPINPVALKLAVLDGAANVVYLGRPGQYLDSMPNLSANRRYWLSARFAPEVVAAYVVAVRELATLVEATTIDLVGFSGGGALAALVAARLKQQEPSWALSLRTVAGNLDTDAWTSLRKITPLAESLNPADEAATLRNIPQIHLLGLQDRQVPRAVFEAYAAKLGGRRCLRAVEVDAAHAGPWEDAWREVLTEPVTCAP
ncbi:MAG: alpha/beta hydrolase [Pseudomonadota bacterium]